MKIKDCFWRKNIFGELRRLFLGINCDDVTWRGLKKDHALEWGNPNENPGYWSPIFDKIYTQEEEKNELKLINSNNNFNLWATANPNRGDRPKVSRRVWDQGLEDIIETWYLKNFILSEKIISDYISNNKISTGDEIKLHNIITERLTILNKVNNLNFTDIYAWTKENTQIFNKLNLDTTWFVQKNLKKEIEKYLENKSFIILFNTEEDKKSFYTTIINEGEFLETLFFENIKNSKNNGGYIENIKLKNNKIEENFLYLNNSKSTNMQSDNDERVKVYQELVAREVNIRISKLAIEDRYQEDINTIEPPKSIKVGPIEKKNRKGYDLSDKYKYQRNPLYSAYALKKANYLCELDNSHKTFKRENSRNYVEGHHVIPMHAQEDFEYSIDVPENIVALCPNCHRKVHSANEVTKKDIVNKLFKIIKERKLSDRKIVINEEQLENYYI